MQEIFKDIEGYEDLYQVSNLGNVKSYYWNKQGKILTPRIHSAGYERVTLSKKDYFIHRLVAKAFIDNPNNKREVNHINGNKADNRLENLEWTTPSENQFHAYRTGLKRSIERRGKNSPLSMPVIQLTLDNIVVANYSGIKEAARQIGGNSGGISKCCRGIANIAFGFKWQYSI